MTLPENTPPIPPIPPPPNTAVPQDVPAAPFYPPGYAAPGYANTLPPAQNPYAQAIAPTTKRSPMLGIMSLALAMISALIPAIMIAIAFINVARYLTNTTIDTVVRFIAGEFNTVDLSILAPVRGWILLGEISFWAGTIIGLWALIQGIIATVTGRGRAVGIAAIVVAVAAPFIYFTAAAIAISSGAIAGLPG